MLLVSAVAVAQSNVVHTGTSNDALVAQTGMSNVSDILQNGMVMMLMWNRLGFEQCENYSNGRYAYSSQVQTGDSNKATAQQYSGSSSITQIQNGDNNVALQTKMGSFMERMV
jgi:hypothetical protein